MESDTLQNIMAKVREAMRRYAADFPEVHVDRDYYPFKITEEWGECMQAYLMLTDRGRQKGKSKDEIKEMLSNEIADVLGFLLLFADNEGIDPLVALTKKWFVRLQNEK